MIRLTYEYTWFIEYSPPTESRDLGIRHPVLQCVAVCCSVLQCVAVCCSVLQCVAVCCSAIGYSPHKTETKQNSTESYHTQVEAKANEFINK